MPTPTPQSTSRLHVADATNGVPRLSGDIRHLIPKLGLRNYWYPAIEDRTVGRRKPVKVSLLGEEICLFRGAAGEVAAIQDICPHRGARLSEGDCHYQGTVACPYHGWVYDESGKNVMVLSEGPNSGVCGKAGTEAKAYPTRTLKGLVFVWIGEGPPAPIEEDVPEEFFDDETLILIGQVNWRCNWEVALENSMDSHVNYVHRNAVVVARSGFIARGAQGEHPIFVGNGFGGDVAESNYMRQNPRQDV
ncbi:MAG TPA: Rieske 2Fe-2S domain-containing protein, partial [Candidatus Eisenbacteria bacterium]|nr:Rieske 2Fe-2S domain-containing protein [Candidatus Eisenbacteria bacterium]